MFPTPKALPVEPAPVLPSPKSWASFIDGIILVTKDKWSAWTGGESYFSRTGVDGFIALLEHTTTPDQFIPVYVSPTQKGCNFRGMDTRLLLSQVMIWLVSKMLLCVSLVANLMDPTDGTKMTSNMVKSHARYTAQPAKLWAGVQVQLYDKYDRTNNIAAENCLLASLSTELSNNKVTEKLGDANCYPVVWLQFLKSIHLISIERFWSNLFQQGH